MRAGPGALPAFGLVPTGIAYSALFSACEKGQLLEQALELSLLLQQQGLVPNFITYNALISACGKGQL